MRRGMTLAAWLVLLGCGSSKEEQDAPAKTATKRAREALGERARCEGVAPDACAARREDFEKGCAAKDWTACSDLALMVANGLGGEKDPVRARALAQQACDGGYAEGCLHWGTMLEHDFGGPADRAAAIAAYRRSCDRGFLIGCSNLSGVLRFGDHGEQTEARVAAGKACDGGYLEACVNLGILWEEGQGGGLDYAKAREIYQRACEGGVAVACSNLGVMIQGGRGAPPDLDAARAVFMRACADAAFEASHASQCSEVRKGTPGVP